MNRKRLTKNFLWQAAALPIAMLTAVAPAYGAEVASDPVIADAPMGKLSDAAVPSAYRLDVTIDPSKERFSGKTEIDVTLKEASNRIFLHGRDLAIHQAVAQSGKLRLDGNWRQIDSTGVAVLTFPKPLPAGKVTLNFAYDAPFQSGPSGMFRVNVGGEWYSWSQFQSIDARAAFPSFDDPGFKTPFTVTLRTPPGLTAVSNAPETRTTREGDQDVHYYAPTLPLPTYLMAMMVGPFASVAGEVAPTAQRAHPLPLRIISTRGNAEKLSFALEGSKQIVTLLEDYFADGFPYPKLDQITSPVMSGAMENAGADLYRDNLIVMDANAPVPQQRSFGMVVSHELGHQWFGDLVTPRWWDDIWLNESFANWMGYRIGDAWRPDLNIKSGALAEGFAAMRADALVAGRPIRQEITRNSQIDAAFDSITYGKGGHVVSMIAGFLDDTKFRDGVRKYMAAHRYGNATSTDFFAAMAEAAQDPRIVPAMRGFVDQQGVPLLTFAPTDNGYRITQSRYAQLGANPPATQWSVPVCTRQGEERSCALMTEQSMDIAKVGAGPLIPNAGGTGYYRFELPKGDWDALIRNSASLPGGEAQALVDSLMASVQAGRSSARQIAELARHLANHPDSYAAQAGGDAYAWLEKAELVDDKAMPAYRRFAQRLYAPLLKQKDLDLRLGAYAKEDAEVQQNRTVLVERMVGKDAALDGKLVASAQDWLGGNTAALDPAWYGSAFEAYLEKGGLPAAQTLMERALASQDETLRPTLLAVVGTSGNEAIARWVLDDFKDSRLRPTEQRGLLSGVMERGKTREIGYAYIIKHLDEMLTGGGIFFASRLPRQFAGFCSAQRADEIAREFRPRFVGKTGELELERTIEQVRNCGVLKDARRAEVSREIARLR